MVQNHFYDYKGSYLFSEDEMFPRENVDQVEFNNCLAPIVVSVKDAFAKASIDFERVISSIPFKVRNKAFIASLWNELILFRLMQIPEIEHDRLEGNRRRTYFKVGRSKVFVKKVDARYRTSNIETGQVAELREQLSTNMVDRSPVLFMGYQLDETGRHITDISVICRKGDKLEWVTDVINFNSNRRTLSTRVYITLDEEPDYNVSVKPGLKSKSV